MQHPTIRALSGVQAPQKLNPTGSALLVIDFQNEYFSGRLPIPLGKQAVANALRLIERADARKMPVYHIQHMALAGSPVFADGSDGMQFYEEIRPAAHHTVLRKTSVSVFPTTDLYQRLQQADIKTLLICGLMTHACVAGAARDAVPLGYEVVVAEDACATRDLDIEWGADSGGIVPYVALHRAALASIEDTFGTVMTTAQVLQRL